MFLIEPDKGNNYFLSDSSSFHFFWVSYYWGGFNISNTCLRMLSSPVFNLCIRFELPNSFH